MTYHSLYLDFFRHYHKKEYWEAHEVLEELWQEQRDNDFYHGLIQVAAIMHQLNKGKVRGARKLATTALRYLRAYTPTYEAVDVANVLVWLQRCLDVLPAEVERMEIGKLEELQISICKLPRFE